MTMPVMESNRPSDRGVNAALLWPGGIATAIVAGLVALLGILAFTSVGERSVRSG